MPTTRAYDEVIDFIASGTSPETVADYRPSEAARDRVADLLAREKEGTLSPEETSELDTALQVEHIMRLANARARKRIAAE